MGDLLQGSLAAARPRHEHDVDPDAARAHIQLLNDLRIEPLLTELRVWLKERSLPSSESSIISEKFKV